MNQPVARHEDAAVADAENDVVIEKALQRLQR